MNKIFRTGKIFFFVAAVMLFCLNIARAGNIDPNNDGHQWAWGENIGWLNFNPSQGSGVTVGDSNVTGWVWSENIGWINLSPQNFGGVTNDGSGNLSGWAWGENVGWFSFSCENTNSCATVKFGVTIDSSGTFDGYAWGENIGWINFKLVSQPAYRVQTSWKLASGPVCGNVTCSPGLVCNENNMCVDPSAAGEGEPGGPCYANGTCNTGLTCNKNNICEEESSCGATPGCDGCCISYMSPESVSTADVQTLFMLRVTGCRFTLREALLSKVTFDGPGGASGLKAPTVLALNDLVFGVMEINQSADSGCYAVTVQTPQKKAGGYSISLASGSSNSTTTIPIEPTTTTTIATTGVRFKDNNNGTITDTRTGLIWLKIANPCDYKSWEDAGIYCSNLKSGEAGLTDGSKAGQWRLPTQEELEGIGTDPPITYCIDDALCDFMACPATWTIPGESFIKVQSGVYWSGTSAPNHAGYVWVVNMSSGFVFNGNKVSSSSFVWPVRDGN